jgi:hypothetical protein
LVRVNRRTLTNLGTEWGIDAGIHVLEHKANMIGPLIGRAYREHKVDVLIRLFTHKEHRQLARGFADKILNPAHECGRNANRNSGPPYLYVPFGRPAPMRRPPLFAD